MPLNHIKYYPLLVFILLAFIFFLPLYSISQGVGRAIINVTFGEGANNPGPQLLKNRTSFSYTTDSCPSPGSYTITNSLYRCSATRIGRSLDHTPSSKSGYMMLVKGTNLHKVLYVDTLKEALCTGSSYEFSAWVLNTSIPANCNSTPVVFPRLAFIIETTAGKVLDSANTGPLPYDYDAVFVPKFHFVSVRFNLPPGINDLVLKIEDAPPGYSQCGYSFALDDIQFTAIGPPAQIAFAGAVEPELVKAVCFQDNKTISMTGSAGYPALQWQQTTDNGVTWTDIPGATDSNYSGVFSIPDTFLFRLTAAKTENIWNPNCRVVSNNLKVEVNGIPTEFTITNNSPVCAGQDLKFNAEGGASYIWSGPNGFYDDIPFPHIFHSSVADSGMYYVDIITVGGCRASDSTYVTMIGTDVKTGPDTSICKGRSVRLQASGGANYVWSPATTLSNSTVANPVATPDNTTIYSVTVDDQYGCSNTGTVTIKILNKVAVKAVIEGSSYVCRPYDSASFVQTSSGEIETFNWNFGNGQISNLATPVTQNYFIADNTTGYAVQLAVKDSSGCTDTAYHTIKVADNCYIAVPTAFTPNGDGVNDYLYPVNAYKATNLLFRVYSRNGQLIFKTRDWTKKWDGTFRGVQQSSGVFVWILEYNDASKKRISLKGSTVLIR